MLNLLLVHLWTGTEACGPGVEGPLLPTFTTFMNIINVWSL